MDIVMIAGVVMTWFPNIYDPVLSTEMGCERKYTVYTIGHSALNNGSLW